jgi:hypothetical protein
MKAVTDSVTGAVTWVEETAAPTTTTASAATAVVSRPGYEYDPYDSPGERAEGMFIGTLLNRFVSDPNGFCSTYREWHIFVRGMYAGFRGPTLGNVPECPPLWQDEAQYFEGAAMVTNVIKCQWPAVVAGLVAVGAGAYTGIIPAGTLSSIVTSLMGLI